MFGNGGRDTAFALAVVAIAKNEVKYLREWLTHYRMLGVQHFFIADNGSTDGTRTLLEQEEAHGDITWEDWPMESQAQNRWYNECLDRFGSRCRWMAFVDLDEFLVSNTEQPVMQQLETLLVSRRTGGIAVNWRIFGSAHYRRMQPGAVGQRFTRASRTDRLVNQHVKCIVKPEAVRKVRVHAPELSWGWHYVTPQGERAKFVEGRVESGRTEKICNQGLVVHHYNVKSLEEFVNIKASRGRANLGEAHRRNLDYFKGHDFNDVRVSTPLSDELQEQHYLALPGMLERRSPLFFVHIPKTAGTSFRLGAAELLGSERVWHDYGAQSEETHPTIKWAIHELKDAHALRERADSRSPAMLVGHVPASRYIDLAGVRNTFSFMRDPVQRVVSDYKHFVRHGGYEGSLESFINRKELQNRQARYLSGAPLHAYGLIGLKERYLEGLALLNHQYGLDICERADNTAGQLGDSHALSEQDMQQVEALNGKDMALYRQAQALFEQRISLHEQHLPFVHGAIQKVTHRQIIGWAWWNLSDMPVELDILIGDETVARVVACELRPGLMRWAPPRGSYVGFKAVIKAKTGSQVSCRVAMTGQVIDSQVVSDD